MSILEWTYVWVILTFAVYVAIGLSVRAAAWAMAALPSPASFEKIPRAKPQRSAIHTVAPANPPVPAVLVKALLRISARAAGPGRD